MAKICHFNFCPDKEMGLEKIYVQQHNIKQVNPIFKNQGNQGVRKDILSNGSVMS